MLLDGRTICTVPTILTVYHLPFLRVPRARALQLGTARLSVDHIPVRAERPLESRQVKCGLWYLGAVLIQHDWRWLRSDPLSLGRSYCSFEHLLGQWRTMGLGVWAALTGFNTHDSVMVIAVDCKEGDTFYYPGGQTTFVTLGPLWFKSPGTDFFPTLWDSGQLAHCHHEATPTVLIELNLKHQNPSSITWCR